LFVNFRFSASTNVRTRGVQAGENIRIALPKARGNYSTFREKGWGNRPIGRPNESVQGIEKRPFLSETAAT